MYSTTSTIASFFVPPMPKGSGLRSSHTAHSRGALAQEIHEDARSSAMTFEKSST